MHSDSMDKVDSVTWYIYINRDGWMSQWMEKEINSWLNEWMKQ